MKLLDTFKGSAAHNHARYQHYEKITERVSDDKYKAALKYIQETLDNPDFDQNDDIYIEDVETCLFELWYEKKPNAVIKAYDAMIEQKNSPLKYLIMHNKTGQIVDALVESLHNYPEIETKAALKKAIIFFSSNHPLMREAVKKDEQAFVYILDDGCYNVFDSWRDDESDTVTEYTWTELLTKINENI